jgi:8-amino-7-oxononanoate synthase
LDEILRGRLEELEQAGLLRQLKRVEGPQATRISIGGKSVLNFSSNDYLGLANHPALKEAAKAAMEKEGTGSGASRLVCGSLDAHHALERRLADFKCCEAALAFSSGYATALGVIPALVSRKDIIVIDKLVHASIVDAARLSGAKIRVFPHNDLPGLRRILEWCDGERQGKAESGRQQVLVVTESLFSMDGDAAPLGEIVELKERHGAWLMVDEAHATGLFGEKRRGLAEALGVSEGIDVQMGTLGKAIGASGGFIAGSKVLIDYLINRARSFVFSTAPPPLVSAAALAGLEVIESDEGELRLRQLRDRVQQFAEIIGRNPPFPNSPIFPLMIGAENAAMRISRELLDVGFYVPAIRYPTVARGKARLRLTFSAAHSAEEVAELGEAVKRVIS